LSLLGSTDDVRAGGLLDEGEFAIELSHPRRRRTVPPRLVRMALTTRVPEEDGPSAAYYRRDTTYRRALALADLLSAALAFGVAVAVAGGPMEPAALVLLPAVVLAEKLMGLYDRDDLVLHKSTLDETPKLFHLATLVALLVVLLERAVVSGDFGTSRLLVLWAAFLVLVVGGRALAWRLARRFAPAERCLIVGPAGARMRLAHKLASSERVHSDVVGYLPLEDERRGASPIRNGSSRRRRSVTIADLSQRQLVPVDRRQDPAPDRGARRRASRSMSSALHRLGRPANGTTTSTLGRSIRSAVCGGGRCPPAS
jgi:hypothetical protein